MKKKKKRTESLGVAKIKAGVDQGFAWKKRSQERIVSNR
jgi:hypothetical protein